MSPVTEKLTILFLAANPADTDQLKLDEELRAIDDVLRESEFRDRFDLRSHWALRYEDLDKLLLRYNPHIVHFSGHGSQTGEILLQDATGASHPVSPEALARLFTTLKDNIRCVVLNACYSDQQARGIAKSIDCVAGMTRAVTDTAAIDFAAGFYLGLGFGRSVQTAFELGSNRIALAGLDEAKTPKLTVRKGIDAAQVVLVGTAIPPKPTKLTKLTGPQFKQFQDALRVAFNDQSLSEMVRLELEEDLSDIASGNGRTLVFQLIDWAQRTGNLDRLLDGALNTVPGSSDLQNLAKTLRG